MNLIPLISGFPKNYIYLTNIIPSEYVAVVVLENNNTATLAILNQQSETIYKKKRIHVLFQNFNLIQESSATTKKSNICIENFYGFYSLEPDNLESFSLICVLKDTKTLKYYTIQNNYTDLNTNYNNVILHQSFNNYNKPINISSKIITSLTDSYKQSLNRNITFSYIETTVPEAYSNRLVKGQNFIFSTLIDDMKTINVLPPSTSNLFPILKYWEPSFVISYMPEDVVNVKMEFSTGVMMLKYIDETIINSTQSIKTPSYSNTILFALNLAPIYDLDSNTGIYLAACGDAPRWSGCTVYKIIDDTPIEFTSFESEEESVGGIVKSSTNLGVYGVLSNSAYLKSGARYVFDTNNTITVSLFKQTHLGGVLESSTKLEILSNRLKNLCVVGNELIQYVTSEKIDDRTYKLSTLLRGRKNTENYIDIHTQNEPFLLISENPNIFRRLDSQFDIANIDSSIVIKSVSVGQDENLIESTSFIMGCAGILPYSPSHANFKVLSDKSIQIIWNRRARINTDWVNSVGVGLDESTELYEVDILLQNGEDVIRTISAITNTITYTKEQQLFDTNATGLDFLFNIYQLSSLDSHSRGEKTSLSFLNGDTLYIPKNKIITASDTAVIFKVDNIIHSTISKIVELTTGAILSDLQNVTSTIKSRVLTLNWLEDYDSGRYHKLPVCLSYILNTNIPIIRKRVLVLKSSITNIKSIKLPPLNIQGFFKIQPYKITTKNSNLTLCDTLYAQNSVSGVMSTSILGENIVLKPCLNVIGKSGITSSNPTLTIKLGLSIRRITNCICSSTNIKLKLTSQFITIQSYKSYTKSSCVVRVRCTLSLDIAKSCIVTNPITFVHATLIIKNNILYNKCNNLYIKAFYRLKPVIAKNSIKSSVLLITIKKQFIYPILSRCYIKDLKSRIQLKTGIVIQSSYNNVINSPPTLFHRIVPDKSKVYIKSSNINSFTFESKLVVAKSYIFVSSRLLNINGNFNIYPNVSKIHMRDNGFVQIHIHISAVNSCVNRVLSTEISIYRNILVNSCIVSISNTPVIIANLRRPITVDSSKVLIKNDNIFIRTTYQNIDVQYYKNLIISDNIYLWQIITIQSISNIINNIKNSDNIILTDTVTPDNSIILNTPSNITLRVTPVIYSNIGVLKLIDNITINAKVNIFIDINKVGIKSANVDIVLVSSAPTNIFTNSDLTTGVLTITHNLGLSAPYAVNVAIFDNTHNQIIPDAVTGTANTCAIDLTSYGTLTGTWGYTEIHNNGILGTFTNTDLVIGVLTITHNLGLTEPYAVNVAIFDNTHNQIIPATIIGTATTCDIDLTSYGTLTGTWGYNIDSVSDIQLTFTNDDLTAGILTITHNQRLSVPYTINVGIFDNTHNQIIPDAVTGTANTCAIDLTSYGTLTGTWGFVI